MRRLLSRLVAAVLTPPVQVALARLLLRLGSRTLRLGNFLLVYRWQDVHEVLHKDEDFLIGPVNEKRIVAVSGPFILGMDRSPELYRQRSCVYNAMRDADFTLIERNLSAGIADCLEKARRGGGRLDVVNGYARLIAGRTASAFFGIAGPDEVSTLRVMRAVFHATFLNVTDDEKIRDIGIAAGKELSQWIDAEVAHRRRSGALGLDVLGRLMHHAPALGFTDEAVQWMLSGLIVGAVDTTATVTANIIKEAISDRELLDSMRLALNDMPILRGWCWEALRRRPHNPAVVRSAGPAAQAAGRAVKPGTLVYALTCGAMQDPAAFPNPGILRPDRPPERYMHFGHGLHECAGRKINAYQIPRLVGALVDAGVSGSAGIRFSGPFPDELMVQIGGATT